MSNRIIVTETEKRPALFICKNRTIERVWIKEHMTVGRSTESCMADINLEAGFVSREHGIVEYDAPNTYYLDIGSKNGTYYNGVRLKTGEKVSLSDGDVLQIFSWNDGKRGDFVSILYSTRYPDNFVTEILDIKNDTAEINIGDPDGMAGNTDFNAATFFVAQKGWAIAGHGDSRVFLNGKQAEKPKYLQLGDSVRIKNLYFWYTGDAIVYAKQTDGRQIRKSGLPSLRINIVERSVWQRTKKLMLLQNINMTIRPGEMVLILGGSGAGKTTFMNAVMGYEKAQGKIMHGDTDIYEDYVTVSESRRFYYPGTSKALCTERPCRIISSMIMPREKRRKTHTVLHASIMYRSLKPSTTAKVSVHTARKKSPLRAVGAADI